MTSGCVHVTRLGLAFVIAALAFSHSHAAAWCQFTTQDDGTVPRDANGCALEGAPLRWQQNCISYSLEEGASQYLELSDIRPLVLRSFQAWEDVLCSGQPIEIDIRETEELSQCNISEYNREGGNINSIMFVSDWNSRGHASEAFALTTVWHDKGTGRILDADMEINEMRGTYGNCPDVGDCSVIDVRNVITHEAGHFLGLAHSADEEATMFLSASNRDIEKRTLAADDVEAICNVYPPGSFDPQCESSEFTPIGGFDNTCGTETTGCACSAPASGEPSSNRMGLLAAIGVLGLGLVLRRR